MMIDAAAAGAVMEPERSRTAVTSSAVVVSAARALRCSSATFGTADDVSFFLLLLLLFGSSSSLGAASNNTPESPRGRRSSSNETDKSFEPLRCPLIVELRDVVSEATRDESCDPFLFLLGNRRSAMMILAEEVSLLLLLCSVLRIRVAVSEEDDCPSLPKECFRFLEGRAGFMVKDDAIFSQGKNRNIQQ